MCSSKSNSYLLKRGNTKITQCKCQKQNTRNKIKTIINAKTKKAISSYLSRGKKGRVI